MHIIGHALIGIGLSITMQDPMYLLGSLAPDWALIPNELRFKKFNKWDIKAKWLYDITHSIYAVILMFFINIPFALGYAIHILIDIPFHTSSFRWKPLLINRYKVKRKALLLSGGMDSIACSNIEKDFDCIYFNYGQEYNDKEIIHARRKANKLGKELIIIKKDWYTDIENRNFYMINELKRMGYDEVILGTRNVLPLFDSYGDSNWFSLKVYQWLIGIYINMPLIGQLKYQIRKKADSDTYYSTENYHKINNQKNDKSK